MESQAVKEEDIFRRQRSWAPATVESEPKSMLFVWGHAAFGQLGLKEVQDEEGIAAPVKQDHVADVVDFAGAMYHSLFLTGGGEVFGCGLNETGCLSSDCDSIQPLPHVLGSLQNIRVMQVACGMGHTICVDSSAALVTFGDNSFGQLGQGTSGESAVRKPRMVRTHQTGIQYVRAAAGENHSMALSSIGQVFTFGCGSTGALGHGSADLNNKTTPTHVTALWDTAMVDISCGDNHSLALGHDGKVYSWGRNHQGQVGCGDMQQHATPILLKDLHDTHVVQITAGGEHSLAVARCGEVFAWGCAAFGAVGLGSTTNASVPTLVHTLKDVTVVQASAGSRHSLFLARDCSLWATGPRAGASSNSVTLVPVPVAFSPGEGAIFSVRAAGDHCMLLAGPSVSLEDPPTAGPRGPYGANQYPLRLPSLYECLKRRNSSSTASSLERHHEVTHVVVETFASPALLLAAVARFEQDLPAGAVTPGVTLSIKESSTPATPLRLPSFSRSWRARAARHSAGAEVWQRIPAVDQYRIGLAACKELYSAVFAAADPAGEMVLAVSEATLGLLRQFKATLSPAAKLREESPQVFSRPWLLAVLLLNPVNSARLFFSQRLLEELADCVCALPPKEGDMLVQVLALLSRDDFVSRCLRPVQAACTNLASGLEDRARRPQVLRAVNLLHVLYLANVSADLVPASEFYNEALSQESSLDHELYLAYQANRNQEIEGEALITLQESGKDARRLIVSLCQVPECLTPAAKSELLRVEAASKMNSASTQAALQALIMGQGQGFQELGALIVRVRRESVLQDALACVAACDKEELRRPLRVQSFNAIVLSEWQHWYETQCMRLENEAMKSWQSKLSSDYLLALRKVMLLLTSQVVFVANEVEEEGVDQGGVKKEFFQLLTKELFNPEYGMWTQLDDGGAVYFSTMSPESKAEYKLTGQLLGLAIYNSVILDLHFPLVLYKILLGGSPSFEDLKQAQPALAAGLQKLLDYDGDVQATFNLTFEVEYDYFGLVQKVELKSGGSEIAVTSQNREEYVQLYAYCTLAASVMEQLKAFCLGFHETAGGFVLTLLTPSELETLVCGSRQICFEDLEASARYEGGFTSHSPVVVWLWQLLHSFSLEQKLAFLQFTTGSSRIGIGGLQLVIQRGGGDSSRLPTTHTCFNVLLLPEYATREKLEERLLLAMHWGQVGFGLQ